MENLNKENFFNRMQELYPEAMKHFCNWIDEYKKKVRWKELFGEKNDRYDLIHNEFDEPIIAPKFHDIPFEMQFGIMLRYASEALPDNPSTIGVDEMIILFESVLAVKQVYSIDGNP